MIANQRITRTKDVNFYSGRNTKPQQPHSLEVKQRLQSNSSKNTSKTPSQTPSRTPAKKQQNQGISKSPKKTASLKTPRTCTEKKQTTNSMRNHSNTHKYGYACETTQRKTKQPVSQQTPLQQDTKKKIRKVLLVKNPILDQAKSCKSKLSSENDQLINFSQEDFKKLSTFADSLETIKDNQHSKLVRSLVQYSQQLIKSNQILKEKNQTLNRKHRRLLTLLSSNNSQSPSPQASQKKKSTSDISIHHSQTKQKQHNQIISQFSGNKSALSHRSFNSSANPLDDGLESQRKRRVTSTPQQKGTPFRLTQEPIWSSSPFQFESPSGISPIAKRILSMTNSPESNQTIHNNNIDNMNNNNNNYQINEESQEQSKLQQSVIAFIQSSTQKQQQQQQCDSPQFNQHFHNVISNRINTQYTNSSLSSSFRNDKSQIAFTNLENFHESNKENIPLFASSQNNHRQHQGIVEQTSSLLRSPSFVNLSTEQIYMMTKQKSNKQCHHSFQCIPQVDVILPEQQQQEPYQHKAIVLPQSTITTTSGTTATTTASNSKKTIFVGYNKNISNTPSPAVQIKKPTKIITKSPCKLSKSARAAHINVGEYLGEISCVKNKQRAISLQPQTKLQQQQQQQQHRLSASAYNPEHQQVHKQRLQKRIDSMYHYREASLSLKYQNKIYDNISQQS